MVFLAIFFMADNNGFHEELVLLCVQGHTLDLTTAASNGPPPLAAAEAVLTPGRAFQPDTVSLHHTFVRVTTG